MQRLKLPDSRKEWVDAAQNLNLASTSSMYEQKTFESASKMLDVQYVLLRVIWHSHAYSELSRRMFGDDACDKADGILNSSESWQRYLKYLPKKTEKRSYPASRSDDFTIVRWEQLNINKKPDVEDADESSLMPGRDLIKCLRPRDNSAAIQKQQEQADARKQIKAYIKEQEAVLKSPWSRPRQLGRGSDRSSSTGSSISSTTYSNFSDSMAAGGRAADDEQLVQIYLTKLVDALCAICPDLSIDFTSKRKVFRFGELWKAATDGYFRGVDNHNQVHAIVEVKRFEREDNVEVRKQEAGEMACWIADDPSDTCAGIIGKEQVTIKDKVETQYRRLLVSQDCDEIYVILAEYPERYEKYINNNKQRPDSYTFMYMTEYGPFKIDHPNAMRRFAQFLLSFLYHQTARYPSAPSGSRGPKTRENSPAPPSRSRTPGPRKGSATPRTRPGTPLNQVPTRSQGRSSDELDMHELSRRIRETQISSTSSSSESDSPSRGRSEMRARRLNQ